MLTVWGRADSSNVQSVMWCIGELGLEYRRIDAGHRFGGLDTPEFKKLNPNRTIPVIQEEGQSPLWESGAIIRYLSQKYGCEPFWTKDLQKQSNADQWAEWAKLNIAMGFTGPVFWQIVRTPPDKRDLKSLERGLRFLNHYLDIAEKQLEKRKHLASDAFTIADVQFGHVLFRYFDINIARPQRPALDKYYFQLTQRPAFKEHVMVSYDVLRYPG